MKDLDNPIEGMPLTSGDTDQALDLVWAALHCYREELIPEGDQAYDAQWSEICTAMAWIQEAITGED